MLYRNTDRLAQFNAKSTAKLHLNILFFERVYSDGTIKIISSEPDLIKIHCKDNLKTPVDIANSSSTIFSEAGSQSSRHVGLLTPELVSPGLADLFEQYEAYNPLTITQHYKNHSDTICFQHQEKATNSALQGYFSNIDKLYNIHNAIQAETADLFSANASDKILLHTPIAEFIRNYYTNSNKDKKLLSNKQTLCLYGIARGMTAKEIAKHLGLSFRTVQHHIDAIKIKLNCFTRMELIDKAEQLGIISFKHPRFKWVL